MRLRSIGVAAACVATTGLVAIPLATGQTSGTNNSLFGVMNGKKEVNAQGKKNTGDPDGAGTFSALVAGNRLCFGITVSKLDKPVAAHIHKGGPNVAGPVFIPLSQPTGGDPGASSGCVAVTAAQSKALTQNPGQFYVNVHSSKFPDGAVRGQLFARSG